MNAYLSREEREQYIRLTCLRVVIDDAIGTYSGLKNIDKPFLSELKHARTRLDKALNIRLEALDPEANQNLYRAASKLKLMFLATPEAKKATQEMLALKSTLPMSLEDFEDWYSFVIEDSCKTCTRDNYAECPARRVLTKYDVFPADPAAKNKCQYSYVGTDLAENPAPETAAETVPVRQYNYAVAQNMALETKLQELRDRLEANELQASADQVSVVTQGPEAREKQPGMIPVTLVMASGTTAELDLPERLAKCLLEDMRRPGMENRSICACQVDGEMVVVDMAEVVMIKAPGMTAESPAKNKPAPTMRPFDDSGKVERYRVECRCGAEYFCSMNTGRDRARCRNCNSSVFPDRQAATVYDAVTDMQATLMTNRYFVDRGMPKAPAPAALPADQQQRKLYRDPCDPFRQQ